MKKWACKKQKPPSKKAIETTTTTKSSLSKSLNDRLKNLF